MQLATAGLLRSFVDSHKPDDVNDLLSTEDGKEALRVAGAVAASCYLVTPFSIVFTGGGGGS